MKVYLSAYDKQLPDETLSDIKSFKFDGLRRDIESLNQISPILSESFYHGLRVNLLINRDFFTIKSWLLELGAIVNLPGELYFEIGNEWDRFYSPKEARDIWLEAYFYLGDRMITGGISSLKPKAIKWLKEAIQSTPLPIIGFHPYRTTVEPDISIVNNIKSIREFAPLGCMLVNTECGWHTCKSKINCFKSVKFTDEQVLAFLRRDIYYHEVAGVEMYTVYQLNDGSDRNYYEDNFGIRDINGNWKPSARVLTYE